MPFPSSIPARRSALAQEGSNLPSSIPFEFSRATRGLKRSAVREFLKLVSRPGMISFAGGLPDSDLFDMAEITRTVGEVLTSAGGAALQYGTTEGLSELRDWIAVKFSARPENVLIVSGAQQALDLIGRAFLDPGDGVCVESPAYLGLLGAWRPLQPNWLSIPLDGQGMQVEKIDPSQLASSKLIYCTPNFQNPTGSTMSLARRQQLLKRLEESGAVLVEDDPYADLRYEGAPLPTIRALSAPRGSQSRVIYVGSFSKSLFPGLRIGYVIAATEIIDKLTLLKQAADLNTNTFAQHLVLALAKSGAMDRQVERLRKTYQQRRDLMLECMAAGFPAAAQWNRPEGGMFVWASLPENIDTRELLAKAVERNVLFVPGAEFTLDGSAGSSLRLNFTWPKPSQIEEGIDRLSKLMARA